MKLQRISLALAMLSLCLIAIVPFASRIHFTPLAQWFGEINVVWLMVACGVFLLPSGQLFAQVPRAARWCLVLACVWAWQPQWVAVLFPGLNYSVALAWLGLALLASMVVSLRTLLGDRPVAVYLAWAVMAGGAVQALIGLAQVAGVASSLGLFYDGSRETSNIFGHIGQRNQYAHYLMWSVVAGCYLYAVGRCSRLGLSLWVLWMALMLGWAGSRTILLYLFALSALVLLWHGRCRSDESRRLMWAMWAACAAVLVLQFALPWINVLLSWLTNTDVHNASGLARLAANGDDMGSRRLAEMHKAWMVFVQHPWWGVGWSQYAAQSVKLQTLPMFADAGLNSGLFTHSHNVITQLLAEMGSVVTLLVLLGFAWVIWPFFSQPAQPEGVLALGCVAVTLIHSMLEYPLWYYYFLAMLVVFIALAPRPVTKPLHWPWRLPLVGAFLVLAWLSVVSVPMFWELVDLYRPRKDAVKNVPRTERLIEIVNTRPLFAYHALYALDDYLSADKQNLKQKLTMVQRLTAFRPYPYVMLKQAKLEVLAGQEAKAEQTLRTTLASFPTYAKPFLAYLDEGQPQWRRLRGICEQVYARLPEKYRGQEEE